MKTPTTYSLMSEPISLAARLRFDVEQTLQQLYADSSLAERLDDLYLPFAQWVAHHASARNKTLVVGMGGPQGCGKTTFATVVSHILTKGFNLNAVVVSLDDLYYTRAERHHHAEQIHPLFATRGVPGTHDVMLAEMIFERLCHLCRDEVMFVPTFDKSLDDRKPVHKWTEVVGPVDVILFEGWCVGANAAPDGSLSEPLNSLEAQLDVDGHWRHGVNRALAEDYTKLFSRIDIQCWMQPPSFDVVYDWRNKQERMLEAHLHDIHGGILDTLDLQLMSEQELRGFMHYFERITKRMIAEMPKHCDVLFELNEHQRVMSMVLPQSH